MCVCLNVSAYAQKSVLNVAGAFVEKNGVWWLWVGLC